MCLSSQIDLFHHMCIKRRVIHTWCSSSWISIGEERTTLQIWTVETSFMDLLVQIQGFAHIASQIFQCLDDKSLCQSRLVSRKWRQFIDKEKFWCNRIVQSGQKSRFCQSQEWKDVFEKFPKENQRLLAEILQEFFANCQNILYEDDEFLPYQVPVFTENFEHIALLWNILSETVSSLFLHSWGVVKIFRIFGITHTL